jgi:hypothetical protein
MGTTNEKTTARSTQTKVKSDNIARRHGTAGGESSASGHQQERDYRASSSQSSIFSTGTSVTGGMLDHLIDEYCDQVTAKEAEVARINDEIKRLKTRVHEFKALREELHKQTEDN